MKHPHSLANYPKKFKGTVISPTKICLQFQDVQVKFRQNLESTEWSKMPDGHRAIPIYDTGTDVETSNMGCQLPVLEEVQLGLLEAYIEYGKQYKEIYKEKYGKEFKEFLLKVQEELNKVIKEIEDGGTT